MHEYNLSLKQPLMSNVAQNLKKETSWLWACRTNFSQSSKIRLTPVQN